jgi:hypothetical protein
VRDKKEPKAEKDMKLVELCRVMGPVEAEVIKNFLESQGIECILQGQMVQAVYPILVDGLGEIRVLVAEKDFATATELLETHQEGGGEEG